MVVPPHDRVIGGYFTGFLARRNYPQPTGTRPAAGIKASPNIGTTNGGQAQKYNCSTRMISTSYCLRGLSTAHAEPQRWHTTFAETAVSARPIALPRLPRLLARFSLLKHSLETCTLRSYT